MKLNPRSLVGILLLASLSSSLHADYAAEVLADNPVAYWRLDDADGSNVADSSGNEHHGAVDGADGSITFGEPGLVPAETANGSISLAGLDRIIVPGFEKIGENGFSAEYWVNVPMYPAACCDSLVSDGESGGDFWMMNYLIGPGQGTDGAVRPHFGVPGTVSITTNANPLALNQTYHVVTVYDAVEGMGHVYFNGVAVLSSPVTATVPAPGAAGDNDIFIGRDGRENRPSNFKIDEVALYDYPLTPERIASHFATGAAVQRYDEEVLADSPLAYWRLDDADGSEVADSSGNDHNGAVDGAEGSIAFGEPGLLPNGTGNGSITLAGFDRIIVPGFEKIGDDGFTAEYWVNVTEYPAACCDSLVSDGESGGDFWMMNYLIGPGQGTNGAVRPHFGVPGTVSITTNDTPLALEQTTHVVTVYDAVNEVGHVYFNGVPVLSAPVTATVPAPGAAGDNNIFIGRDGRENRPSNFKIDEIALYDRPLDPLRIAAHYAAGTRVITYEDEVLADNPIAYWRLDDADGGEVVDSSGNDHHGAVDGGEGSISFGETGLLPSDPGNGSINLSGRDRIIVPGFDKIGDAGYSAEYWLRLDQLPAGFLNLVGDGTGGGTFFMMNYTNPSGIVRPHYSFANQPVSLDTAAPNLLQPDMLYHIVTTWDATDPNNNNGKIYINGELVREGNVTGNPDPANEGNSVYIGRDDRENRDANLTIDEVALYDYPLSAERIAAHFAAGTGGRMPPTNYEEEVLFDLPLAYWRLGEADGPTAVDSSGNGNDATADDGVAFAQDSLVPPDPDTAVGVSGEPRLVSPAIEKSINGTSIDFWVLFNAAPADGAFSNLVGDGEAENDFHITVQAGGAGIIRVLLQTDTGIASVESIESLLDERMHHVVATWDAASGDLVLHIDGAEVDSANQDGTAVNSNNPIYVGRDGRGPGLFNGVIDEVAIYDFALPAERIEARFQRVDVPPPPPPPVINGAYANLVLSDGPVAYWRLDEPDGSIVYDRSGNNNHGAQDGADDTITYGGESLVAAEPGNGSISLAGSDRLLFPGFNKIGADGYTAEYWVKVTAYPGACCDNLVGDGQPGGDFFMMNYLIGPGQGDDGAIRPHFSFGNTPISITTAPPNVLELDTVYHVVTTWDTAEGTGNVYFDGELVHSLPVTSNAPSAAQNAYPIYIGRDGRENRPSNFMIDEVALYDYALSAEQIQTHYNVGINPEPLVVRITDVSHDSGTGEFSISWESKLGKLYNLRSEADPAAGAPIDWAIFGGNENVAATPPENTLSFALPADAARFFVVEEFNAPPVAIFSDDFESGEGDWTTGSEGGPGTNWELGMPTSVGPPAANSPANCFGTNISDDYSSDANVWLRSPAIDLGAAGAATLHYAHFRDIETGFDSGSVRVLDAADDSLIAVIEDAIDDASVDWEDVSKALPAEALGKAIKIEFRFNADDISNFAGWYIDDVAVTVP